MQPMPYICAMCDKHESNCPCDKFCVICKSDEDVRLCFDGCYYCQVCREVCELSAEN